MSGGKLAVADSECEAWDQRCETGLREAHHSLPSKSRGEALLRSIQVAELTVATPIHSPATSHLHRESCRSKAAGPLRVKIAYGGVSNERRSGDVLPNVRTQ